MPELETVDLLGVEILSAGGPVHGVGSPPEGDHWTPDQLRGMADAAGELADEVKPAAKIGHKGGDPAVGWLENIRVNEDGSRLLADIRKVPKGLSGLIEAGAYRQRSVELSKLTSQTSGKKHPWVVTGLAWLGGKMPAVRTLADVVKLYEGEGDDAREFVQISENDADPEGLRDAIADAGRLLAEGASRDSGRPSDSRPGMRYTDEQRRKFTEATGLDPEKATDETLAAAGVAEETEDPKVEATVDETANRDLEARLQAAEKTTAETAEQLRLERRRNFVEAVIRDGKEEPGRRSNIETLYDKFGHDDALKHYEDVKPDADLAREYGSSLEPVAPTVNEEEAEAVRQFEADMAFVRGDTFESKVAV